MKAVHFPIQIVEKVTDSMACEKVSSKLDMFASHWQIQLVEHVQEMPTFTCKYRSFIFIIVLFRLMNKPGVLQRVAGDLFGNPSFVTGYTGCPKNPDTF